MFTRIFYATDLHGSEKCFMKLLRAGEVYKPNVIIVGGDITGKMIIPIIKQSDGYYKVNYLGVDKILKNEEEIKRIEQLIKDGGNYPYLTNEKEIEELTINKGLVESLFLKLMVERVENWLKVAEEKLKNKNIKLFITPGNDDSLEIDTIFEKYNFINVMNPEGKVVEIDGYHEMISTGYSNVTPWKCPRDISEEELEKKIEIMISNVKNVKNAIFNFHCPPYDSGLDTAPKLNENFKPVTGADGFKMIPVGSIAVRKAIEKYQPLLGLHGHIHESRGVRVIGRTLCINPGSEYGEGILRGAIVNLEKDKVKGYMLTSG
ncbi:metallophosphoesterase [Candidatus Bathyarchaeota archaeon]|nr:metallophosphoesterase [Candidatus Bathyarchaeota archaeon]